MMRNLGSNGFLAVLVATHFQFGYLDPNGHSQSENGTPGASLSNAKLLIYPASAAASGIGVLWSGLLGAGLPGLRGLRVQDLSFGHSNLSNTKRSRKNNIQWQFKKSPSFCVGLANAHDYYALASLRVQRELCSTASERNMNKKASRGSKLKSMLTR